MIAVNRHIFLNESHKPTDWAFLPHNRIEPKNLGF